MLKILHIYPQSNEMIAQYVGMIEKIMRVVHEEDADLVHCHGCLNHTQIKKVLKMNKRFVFSPHGQLHPWIVGRNRQVAVRMRQRELTQKSYAIITQGELETNYLRELDWNPRLEQIANPLYSSTISEESACQQLMEVYQKVMDSDVWGLMTKRTRVLVIQLLKAGITQDKRWIAHTDREEITRTEARQIRIFAIQEGVEDVIQKGIEIMGVDMPLTKSSPINNYLPIGYQKPASKSDIMELILSLQKKPTLRHLVDMHKLLRQDNIEDDKLTYLLKEKHLLKFTQRLMAVMADFTLLEEGFMPLKPIYDNKTKQIETSIIENLKI